MSVRISTRMSRLANRGDQRLSACTVELAFRDEDVKITITLARRAWTFSSPRLPRQIRVPAHDSPAAGCLRRGACEQTLASRCSGRSKIARTT